MPSNPGLFVKLEGNIFIKDYSRQIVKRAVVETTKSGVEILRQNTPKDTGYASTQWRNSSSSFTDYHTDRLYNTTDYLVFVDEGTRYIQARHFVAKSQYEIEDLFLSNLERGLSRLK
jgi:hypothetical protein